jgi:DNA uptake protein ComE-like DNA-binding protein
MSAKKFAKGSLSDGSALILAVVLTSLLAIVGVLFVMMARVNKIASSGISESKELDAAIETVIAKISDELALDVPGVAGPDYYDYPDANNAWLASLEPYDKPGVGYCWRHTSDIDGTLGNKANDLEAGIIDDYQNPSELEDNNNYSADADGDGVADSKWIELADITSSRGRPIYAAIRIIDNGGMLNVNTAYMFDPNDLDVQRIDGSSLMQINLFTLAQRGTSNTIEQLDDARYGNELHIMDNYIKDVVWRYNEPNGRYTPFDISDELELRNRFLLEFEHIDTRIEKEVWTSAFTGKDYLHVPVDSAGQKLTEWFYRTQHDVVGPNDIYSYRHIATTYNMDRIINPYGVKMTNVSDANVDDLYDSIRRGFLDANYPDVNGVAAQITVNLKDYVDGDSDVTSFVPDVNGPAYYGFERPCIYISELAHKFVEDAADPSIIYRSYAIELYKPYFGDDDPNNWRLVIDGTTTIDIDSWTGGEQFCVIRKQDPDGAPLPPVGLGAAVQNEPLLSFDGNDIIELQRLVDGNFVVVDSKRVPDANLANGWLQLSEPTDPVFTIQRDITLHKCIRRLWSPSLGGQTLGSGNNFQYVESPDVYIQAHPYLDPLIYGNQGFKNIGEIGMLFRKGAYYQDPANRDERIGYSTNKTEKEVRLNLADPNYQQLFKYLTVFDPTNDGIDNDGDGLLNESDPNKPEETPEFKIPGRININTAPWYVLAQLPWVSQRGNGYDNGELAREIAKNRNEKGAFENIGQLMRVTDANADRSIDYYYDNDLTGFPDLTPGDGAEGDFEERDVIFARISNLVTVRSDVFTAYILVRIGTDGPQKRVIAILDRSDVYSPTDRVKIVAVHPVADPR